MKCAATPRKILTTTQVAQLREGWTPNAVRILAWRKQLPHFKSGNRLLFDEAEIFAWLEGQRRVTPEEALEAVGR
jgi:Helix-turn-helix domain